MYLSILTGTSAKEMAFSLNSSTTISSEIFTTSLPDRVNLGPFDREVDQMRLLGYPGPVFWIIHITALICLSLSMIVSVILIMFLCLPSRTRPRVSHEATVTVYTTKLNREVPARSHQTTGSFWKWSLSERLVIYLATSDLSYGVSHIMDHAYYLYRRSNPPDRLCSFFGFMLGEFILAEWIIVVYTAVNACSLIVFGRKINPGRKDFRLLFAAYGLPLIVTLIPAGLGLLGQNGARSVVLLIISSTYR